MSSANPRNPGLTGGTRPHRKSFRTGEEIFRPGDPGGVAYIIESGRVEIRPGDFEGPHQLATLGEGEIFGELGLVDGGSRQAFAVAIETTVAYVVDRTHLRLQLGAADPTIRLLMRVLIDRIRRDTPRASEKAHADENRKPDEAQPDYGDGERRAIGQFKFEHELKNGLRNGEFELSLQPIVRLADRRVAGFEALMSWRHPTRGRLAPDRFIAIAERSGLVRELDELALRLSLRALNQLQAEVTADAGPLGVSVNLSGVQAEDASTIDRVAEVIREEAFNPEAITLEITESWLVHNPERAQKILTGLKALGLRLALDDFGTGYSSLAYLHRFPIDYLKVDQIFTRDLTTSADSAKIARAIVGLAHTFGLEAIAEGIDHPDQISALRDMSCDFGQGYYFSPPLELADARRFLAGQ